MSITSIAFKSKGTLLEGIISTPYDKSGPYPAIIACHSHPSFRGHMGEELISAICQAAGNAGFATLRFNFRGTGESGGNHDGGKSERNDIKSALDVIRRWPGIDKSQITVAGYSFGASVIMDGASMLRKANKFVLVSPPPKASRESRLSKDSRPILIIAGENAKLSPPDRLRQIFSDYKTPPLLKVIEGANFSFMGHETEMGKVIVNFLQDCETQPAKR